MNMVTTLHVIGGIIVIELDYAGYCHGSLLPKSLLQNRWLKWSCSSKLLAGIKVSE